MDIATEEDEHQVEEVIEEDDKGPETPWLQVGGLSVVAEASVQRPPQDRQHWSNRLARTTKLPRVLQIVQFDVQSRIGTERKTPNGLRIQSLE